MSRPKNIPIALAAFAAGALGVWGWKAANRSAAQNDSVPTEPRSVQPARPIATRDAISPTFAALDGKPDVVRKSLLELRTSLAAMPKDEAVSLIRDFLGSGKDRSTGLSFEIAKDGSLSEWPTFRSFLLDALLAIDPAAAAAAGREILANPTTADEWALALRNVARGEDLEPNAAYLRQKTEELITHPAWQADPSIGYLNAFDVLVHLEATDSAPLLSGLVQRKDRKDLAHAGFLTLDRLVQLQPSDVLVRLASDQALQQSRPEMVAQQFARADVRDPAQLEIMKSWLLDPARTSAELRSFAGIYPNNNRFVSNNLLTRETSQSGEDLAAHDRAALETVSAWAGDPAFQAVSETLGLMISRLSGFISVRTVPPVSPPTSE